MRLLTSKVLRRSRLSPPLSQFFCNYSSSSSSSHSLFGSSTQHHRHDHNPPLNYFGRCSSALLSPPHHHCFSFSRRFSSQPNLPESDDPFLPVQALISLLDAYHDVTGFPWWIIISSSTVAMRLALFPLVVLQLKKLKRIGDILPKLPPPFPPPLSGRSFRDQIALFWKEKKAAGCPSVFWFISSVAFQVPCFFLWIMSVRRMSLDHHPGFDSGGILWFQDLTGYPHGVLGPIVPLIIAGLHFTNVQVSFQKSSLEHLPGSLGLLAKIYRMYLQLLTLPILIATFNVPQGCLVYWLTNGSLSLIQLLCLRNPNVLEFLGLPIKNDPVVAPANKEKGSSGVADICILTKQGEISAKSLSPAELVAYSIKILTDGRRDTAIGLLRLALEKDPGYARALLIMGQTLLQNKQFAEAAESLESAVSKLLVAGYPTEVEKIDLLILSSQWAGIANIRQGKMEEGLLHLERIAQLEEPEGPKIKAHYYDGLFMLSSALLNVDRKAEALKYLQMCAAYDPSYNAYFELMETDSTDFASDLASSRRDF
ncbi:ALBINO3-like protein 3, mitochondrial [Sesamum alatum]|uniref:ALBINO3-like protein 3, mitochondrial n=1 Tax=Sesamum alatum TaxID=300844 RepID=A0AAE1YCG9_9LAMI|nr:ALBINO3-like protein 3, mitochondrial [Sesamum alatum]